MQSSCNFVEIRLYKLNIFFKKLEVSVKVNCDLIWLDLIWAWLQTICDLRIWLVIWFVIWPSLVAIFTILKIFSCTYFPKFNRIVWPWPRPLRIICYTKTMQLVSVCLSVCVCVHAFIQKNTRKCILCILVKWATDCCNGLTQQRSYSSSTPVSNTVIATVFGWANNLHT